MTIVSTPPTLGWSDREVDAVRARLEAVVATLRAAPRADGAEDEASVMLAQTERVLGRLDVGLYGTCERCGDQIPKDRLRAYPCATYCLTCLTPPGGAPQ